MTPEVQNVRATGEAGSKSALPAWAAVMVQKPPPVGMTVAAVIEQEPVAVNETASADDAAAETENGGSPSRRLGSGANVMVWLARAMTNARGTSGAGA